MLNRHPLDLGHQLHLIDGHDLGVPGRTGTYVFREDQLTIVETSASPSIPHVLEGFRQLGINPADLSYIIVTHIHLDHAGGVGLLLDACPQAKVVVHPKGARHLANPDRLIQGARAVYGDRFDELFHPILPVPEEKLIVMEDGGTLPIGPDRVLSFIDSPGHANHHMAIYDPKSRGVFTGDTAGVYYHQLRELGVSLYLPSTSPNQFDPEAMSRSMARIRELWNPERIYFGHFGVSQEPQEVYRQLEYWLPLFVETAAAELRCCGGAETVSQILFQRVQDHLTSQGVPQDHAVYQLLQLDLDVCAMGLVDYMRKAGQ